MSLAELEELHSLVQGASGPESVFSALRSGRTAKPEAIPAERPSAAVSEALEREYVRLSQIASPERYVGDPNAQATARRILARLYELHQQALDMLGIYDSVDSDDSRRALSVSSTTSTRSPA
jgi:hypothetical protein